MLATGETVGLAEWIIDDTSLFYIFRVPTIFILPADSLYVVLRSITEVR